MKYLLLLFLITAHADEPNGQKLFSENCVTCHGERGKGDGLVGQYLTPKPRNLVKDKFKNGDSVEQIAQTLKTGLDQMPSFPYLSDADRTALATYVKSLRK
jgi:high-affinity iron transporter